MRTVELGLLAGTPGLAAIGLIIAALTVGLRGGAALAGLLLIPLAVPLLVFGAGQRSSHRARRQPRGGDRAVAGGGDQPGCLGIARVGTPFGRARLGVRVSRWPQRAGTKACRFEAAMPRVSKAACAAPWG